jgi:hypothetical protein
MARDARHWANSEARSDRVDRVRIAPVDGSSAALDVEDGHGSVEVVRPGPRVKLHLNRMLELRLQPGN